MQELKEKYGCGKAHPETHKAVVSIEFPPARQSLNNQSYAAEYCE
jgi:hypothetical protein